MCTEFWPPVTHVQQVLVESNNGTDKIVRILAWAHLCFLRVSKQKQNLSSLITSQVEEQEKKKAATEQVTKY